MAHAHARTNYYISFLYFVGSVTTRTVIIIATTATVAVVAEPPLRLTKNMRE